MSARFRIIETLDDGVGGGRGGGDVRAFRFAYSDNAEVLNAYARRAEQRERFRVDADDWAIDCGSTTYAYGETFDQLEVLGLPDRYAPASWVYAQPGVRRPHKRTAAHRAMLRVGRRLVSIPGLPGAVVGRTRSDGTAVVGSPELLVFDDAAWATVPFDPDPFADGNQFGPQWEQITPAGWIAALERYADGAGDLESLQGA